MELKPGYKQTEVGVIPEEWDVVLLDSVSRRASGHTPDKAHPEYWGGDIKWVSLADSHRLDDHYINETTATITAKGIANSSANILPAGCCIVSRDAGVGKSAVLAEEMAVSQHFMAWHCGPSLNNHYLYFLLQAMKPELERIAIGNTIKTIGLPYFKSLRVPLPSIVEQQSIASALLDVDQLIRELAACIAKKRGIRQAAMQELLTGKRRLPGFEGEWETIRLGDHIKYLKNGTNSRAELRADGRVKYLHYGDIHASSRSFASPHDLPSLPVAKAAGLDRLKDGDLIFADASEDITGVSKSVEIYDSRESEVVSGLHTIAARFEKSVLADGFKGFLQYVPSFSEHLRRLAAGTKVYATNRAHISSAEVQMPPVSEQRAIASVLSEMDAELAALETRRDKTRALKQAMMQELLTGRIRLR
jgi:type I restriction enzyme S subunit